MALDFELKETIGNECAITAYYQNELNIADEIHFDECESFKSQIEELQKLLALQNKLIANQAKQIKELQK